MVFEDMKVTKMGLELLRLNVLKHVVEVGGKNNRTIRVNIVHGKEILDVIGAYARQVGVFLEGSR